MKIQLEYIKAREIIDSRGRPTIEVEICASNSETNPQQNCKKYTVLACAPSGASCGKHEAHELRDQDQQCFMGLGVQKAINNINTKITPLLSKIDLTNQKSVDQALIELDQTPNKSNLGANTTIAISTAIAKLNAALLDIPLYQHLNNLLKIEHNLSIPLSMPTPLINVLNGGLHADNNLAIQEFMIMPVGLKSFKDKIRASCEVFHQLKQILKSDGYNTSIGDEGGFAPNLQKTDQAIEYLIKSIEKAGYQMNTDFVLALDVAASSFFKNHAYHIDGHNLNQQEMINFLTQLSKQYPIYSIEDALDEEQYSAWQNLTDTLAQNFTNKIQLVGDDLFVTNPQLLKKGIQEKMANAILIKPNQIGTLTETLAVIAMAKNNNYSYIISHRSGETEDTFISHLAVGSGSGQIKTGSVCRSERNAKYNELIRIEESL